MFQNRWTGLICLEHQTLGQWVIRPIDPATQRTILKIAGFVVLVDGLKVNQRGEEPLYSHKLMRERTHLETISQGEAVCTCLEMKV